MNEAEPETLPRRGRPQETRRTAVHVGLILLILAVAGSVLPDESFWITDNGNRWIQMLSLERTGGRAAIDYPFRATDPELEFFPRGGHHFQVRNREAHSFYGTLFPSVASALHRVMGDAVRVVLPLAGTALVLICSAWMAHRLGVNPRVALWLITFATPVAFYSLTFWEHTLATGLVMLVLLLVTTPTRMHAAASGGALALSTVLREEGYLVALALAAWLAFERAWQRLAVFTGSLIAVLAIHWQTLAHAYGSILGPHVDTYLEMRARPGLREKLLDYAVYLFQFDSSVVLNSVLIAPHVTLIALIPWLVRGGMARMKVLAVLLGCVSGSTFVFGLRALLDPAADLGTLERQGLVPGVPLILLAFLGLAWSIRRGPMGALAATLIVVTGTTPLLLHTEDLGIIWGPRHFFHLFPVIVLLALLAVSRLLETSRRRLWLWAFTMLVVGSLVIQSAGLMTLARKRVAAAEMVGLLSRLDHDLIATDIYWLPEEGAVLFRRTTLLETRNSAAFMRLFNRLESRGVNRFAFVTSPEYGVVARGLLEGLCSLRTSGEINILGGVELMIYDCDLEEAKARLTP